MATLTVISPTFGNYPALVACIHAVREQSVGKIEHIVVADGPDEDAARIAAYYGVRYSALSARMKDLGQTAMAEGLRLATSDYVAFWHTTHYYRRNAATALLQAARDHDIGVIRLEYCCKLGMLLIPRHWRGRFQRGDIDLANCSIRRDFINGASISPASFGRGYVYGDFAMLEKLQQLGARINYMDERPIVHIASWRSNSSPAVAHPTSF